MMVSRIARLVLPVTLLLLSFGLFAQDQHFVYIQTENNQPFYIRMNGKVFSSTAGGYVILSKLANGNYQLFAGFPKNEYPEQEFHVTIDGNDEGFLLKKLGNGWSLFNIETLTLTEGVNTKPMNQEEKKTVTVSNDPFANLLADAVKDSSILENETVQAPPQNKIAGPDTVKAVVAAIADNPVADTSAKVTIEANKDTLQKSVNEVIRTEPETKIAPGDTTTVAVKTTQPIVSDTAATAPVPAQKNAFKRILLVNEKGGLELVYVDLTLRDTIRIFLPVSINNISREEPTAKVIYNPPAKDTSTLTITPTIISDSSNITLKTDSVKVAVHQDAITTVQKQDSVVQSVVPIVKQEKEMQKVEPEPVEPKVSNTGGDTTVVEKVEDSGQSKVIYTTSVNSDCKDFATNKDFLKLRKKMAAETDNDKMIEVARKYFKSMCFTTDQIRNLSYLFLNDEGKYKFFDAAYPFTSNSGVFNTLEAQLKDPYYVNRFRAMIHK